MKTQIITLESYDDLISVRDRLSWAKTPRILLVWPKYEKITLRQVDLKVLQRHASSLGAQLGLVTRQRRVRAAAEALGMPVFESTGQAQRVAWPKVRHRRLKRHAPDQTLREKRDRLPPLEEAWRVRPAVRVSAFTIGVLSVLFLVALLIPRAQVRLNPVTKTQSIVFPVTASPSVNSVFITGSIPAREMQVAVEGKQAVNVTGQGIVPQSKATGVAEFRNLTQYAVTIPAGTIVTNEDGVRFATTEDGALDVGVGKTIDLPIEAMEGGLAGNLEADTINIIEGRLGLLLSVTNPEATDGGRERSSLQASDADRTRVKDLLMKQLEDEARKKMTGELAPKDVLFDKTFEISQILSEVYNPPAGSATATLTLTMQAEFSASYATASDLNKLASLALNASLPSGFSPVSDDVTTKQVAAPVLLDDGSLHWTVRAEREMIEQINASQVRQMILGSDSSTAQKKLMNDLPLASKPKVLLSPSWWPWVPIVPFRVEVVTQ